jgi:hypothetical protein
MSRMIELIRASAVPSNIVQSAAKGSLSMPAPEMIEILVHLAIHNPVFSEQAQLTLAGWDEKSSQAVASDPHAPKEVLEYMIAPKNVRPVLLPALLENLSVPDAAVSELASTATRDAVDIMLKSARVNLSPRILNALASNPNMSGIQAETVKAKIAPPEPDPPAEPEEVLSTALPDESTESDDVLDEELTAYLTEHADEIAADDKPFHPIGGSFEEILGEDEPLAESAAAGTQAGSGKRVAAKKSSLDSSERKGSALQKISKLDVKGRIQLAMKGTKEERTILVRDGTKVVALAVLESPKVTDSEVEMFASQKNVLESLLRGIPLKRRFIKRYPVVRNLVCNPRTPLDVSLTLIKNLMANDLKNLADNKDVSDTVRNLAAKMYKQKRDTGRK